MQDIFHYSPYVTHKKHNLYIHIENTTKFGNKSLRAFGVNIQKTLPEYIKSTTSLLEFKKFIKTWPGPKQKCSVFKFQMRMKLTLRHDTSYAQYFAKVNSGPCQASKVELFAETVNDLKQLKAVIAKRFTLGILPTGF